MNGGGGGALMTFSDKGGTHINGEKGGGEKHELYTGFNMRSVQAEF